MDLITKEQFEKQVKIARDLESVFADALRKTQRLIRDTGWAYDDIRISMFGKLSGILNSAVVSVYFLQNHLTHMTWWEATYRENLRLFKPSISQTISCFDGQARSAMHLGVVANAESAFRILTTAIDTNACVGGEAAFARIYEWLLKKSGQLEDKPIYDLLRHLRNAKLHSDGIYRTSTGKDTKVVYRGKTYKFEVNKSFAGASWELVTNLAQDNLDSMLRIVRSPLFRDHPKILDPQKSNLASR